MDQIRYREMSRGRSDSGGWLRGCLVVFAVVSALGVCGPALYWRFKNAITLRNNNNKLSCPSCLCDCPPPLSLFQLAPGNNNKRLLLLLIFFFLISEHSYEKIYNKSHTIQLFELDLLGLTYNNNFRVSELLIVIWYWPYTFICNNYCN